MNTETVSNIQTEEAVGGSHSLLHTGIVLIDSQFALVVFFVYLLKYLSDCGEETSLLI